MKILFFIIPCFVLLPITGFSQQDCKLKKVEMLPVINRFNPFFYQQSWDEKTKTQTAKMDAFSEVSIKQSGCDRHHIAFVFKVPLPDSNLVLPDYYWVNRLYAWMDRVYAESSDWELYKEEFHTQLNRYYTNDASIAQQYNFPVLERNFFFYSNANEGKKEIHLEIVKYIYNDKVIRPGVQE